MASPAEIAGLMRQLHSRDLGAQDAALAALAGMACDGPAACAAIAAAGGIEAGVPCLFSSSLRIRQCAAAMLGVLVDDSRERCAALVAARGAPALVRLVDDAAAQHPAVLALCSLARCGDEHALQAGRRPWPAACAACGGVPSKPACWCWRRSNTAGRWDRSPAAARSRSSAALRAEQPGAQPAGPRGAAGSCSCDEQAARRRLPRPACTC